MSHSKKDIEPTQKETEKLMEVSLNQELEDKNNSDVKKYANKIHTKESFHLNSLITKNISLFTNNPNYKLLAWLLVQLTIFSLFIFAVNIFKNNLIPYFNS